VPVHGRCPAGLRPPRRGAGPGSPSGRVSIAGPEGLAVPSCRPPRFEPATFGFTQRSRAARGACRLRAVVSRGGPIVPGSTGTRRIRIAWPTLMCGSSPRLLGGRAAANGTRRPVDGWDGWNPPPSRSRTAAKDGDGLVRPGLAMDWTTNGGPGDCPDGCREPHAWLPSLHLDRASDTLAPAPGDVPSCPRPSTADLKTASSMAPRRADVEASDGVTPCSGGEGSRASSFQVERAGRREPARGVRPQGASGFAISHRPRPPASPATPSPRRAAGGQGRHCSNRRGTGRPWRAPPRGVPGDPGISPPGGAREGGR
jgi:hypothetical protein